VTLPPVVLPSVNAAALQVTVGAVLSTLTWKVADPVLSARSVQLAVSSSASPSPDEVELVVQLAGSTPGFASVQFHVTVTSLLFQPSPLAAGAAFGAAVGGVVSGAGACCQSGPTSVLSGLTWTSLVTLTGSEPSAFMT
jgi:hypothetical protein